MTTAFLTATKLNLTTENQVTIPAKAFLLPKPLFGHRPCHCR